MQRPAPDPSAPLDAFNRQVLLLQDEAYTLAFYLLSDETAAASVTQSAFTDSYTQYPKNSQCLRTQVLHAVLAGCSRLHTSGSLFLDSLTRSECCALLLVDHLSLTYEEAGAVLHCSSAQIARRLALARHKSANCDRILSRFPHVKDPNPGGG